MGLKEEFIGTGKGEFLLKSRIGIRILETLRDLEHKIIIIVHN